MMTNVPEWHPYCYLTKMQEAQWSLSVTQSIRILIHSFIVEGQTRCISHELRFKSVYLPSKVRFEVKQS